MALCVREEFKMKVAVYVVKTDVSFILNIVSKKCCINMKLNRMIVAADIVMYIRLSSL